jgi:hypothetical protein
MPIAEKGTGRGDSKRKEVICGWRAPITAVKEPAGKERLTLSRTLMVLGPVRYVLVIDSMTTAIVCMLPSQPTAPGGSA